MLAFAALSMPPNVVCGRMLSGLFVGNNCGIGIFCATRLRLSSKAWLGWLPSVQWEKPSDDSRIRVGLKMCEPPRVAVLATGLYSLGSHPQFELPAGTLTPRSSSHQPL